MNRSVLASAVFVGMILSGLSAYGLYWWISLSRGAGTSVTMAIPENIAPPGAPAVLPVTYQPITAATAEEINKAVPIEPIGPAATPLRVVEGTPAWERATFCLTQAIYYEAGAESNEGQRAVAQVILNRVRSPAFPNSICGVVYQGSERATGCQFTFTCDGSLRRQPSVAGWRRAMGVAVTALRGSVYAPVGNATHYHANYVVPYWAVEMAKISTIGAHIFYRWPGNWRAATYFSQRYANVEPDLKAPPGAIPDSVTAIALAAADNMAVIPTSAGQPSGPPAKPPSLLAADQKPYTLIVGEKSGTIDPRLNEKAVLAADSQGAKLAPTPR